MGEGIKLGGGAGGVINAVIDEFLSVSGDISANSFVEFFSQTSSGTNTQCTTLEVTNSIVRGCVLNNSKAFLLIANGNDSSLYGVVLNLSGTSITVGSSVKVGDKALCGCATIDEGRVFIAYNNANDQRTVRVLTISGTSISAGTALTVDVSGDSPDRFIPIVMPNGYVYLVISDVLKGVQGVLFKVSGTTITVSRGTHAVGANTSGTGAPCAAVRLDDNRIFVYYIYWTGEQTSTNRRQRGVVVTISNGAASVGTVTELSNLYNYVSSVSVCKVSDNKVMCVFDDPNTGKAMHAFIVNVSGSTLSVGSRYTIRSGVSSSSKSIGQYAVRLRDGICAIASVNSATLYFVSIVGTEIEVINSISYSSTIRGGELIVTNGGKILVISTNSGTPYTQIIKYVNGIRPSITQINGLTRTIATTTKPGKVWVLP